MKRLIVAMLLLAGIAQATTNEITASVTLKVNKNATQLTRNTGTLQIQMSGNKFNSQNITATTTNQYLAKGGVGTPGWAYMRNLSTNLIKEVNVSFDGGTTTSMVFKAKEPAVFRVSSSALVTNWTVSANSGTCDFEFTVIED